MNVIIDYKVGNLASVQRGFERAGINTIVSKDKEVIKKAEILILPGVGAFKDAMNELLANGFVELIKNHVKKNKPLIGICLGMQLLFESSTEYGYTKGLGLIPGEVVELEIPYKVPHMGWNDLSIQKPDEITTNITSGDYVYFVHSYYAKTNTKYVTASTEYGVSIPAIVRNNNVIGMQFHPEKSGKVGLNILQSIKELKP